MPKTLARASVDRLLHHAHVIITEGTSLRLVDATNGTGGNRYDLTHRMTGTSAVGGHGNEPSAHREINCPLTGK